MDLVLASPGAVGSSRGAWNSSAPRRPFAIDLFDPHDSIPFASKILLVDELGEEVVVFVAAGLRDPETAGLNPAIAGAGLFRVPPSEGSLQRLPNALPPGIDYGDLPDPPYVTIDEGFNSEHRGARHMIDGFLYLGSGVDGESNGQPTDAADGDDLTGDGAPDDGIVFLDPFVGGSRSTLKATLSYRGYLTGWIDFDKDHVFSESEAIIGSLSLPAGPTELSFQVPLSVSIGDTLYARFRLRETGTPGPNTSPTETKLFKGEVEDYRIIVASRTARDALPMNETIVGTPYPNPASVRTAVRVVLRKQASVTVSVFDLLGRVVLVAQQDRVQPGGETEVAIDLTTLAPGFYFTSVEVNGRRFVNPLVVTR
ncbi:MAG: GEVED domain-containing protein [Rhodothermales bacterium]